MGIYGALTTAVSGLRAQSFALENISGNIANSQTTAYKRTDTAFADLVLGGDLNVRRQTSGSVQSFSRSSNDLQGALTNSTSSTALAINGSGFLMVQDSTGTADGVPTFGGGDLYTRRGDFTVDKNGYVVNGAGYYLMGNALDPRTGNAAGSTPTVVKLAKDVYPAEASTAITYRANLPSTPQPANYVAGNPSSWLLGPTFGETVPASQSAAFVASTVSGDSVTLYDAAGSPQDVQFRWGKTQNGDATATTPTNDTWALYYQSSSIATGTETAWTKVDADPATAGVQDYAFEDGALVTPQSTTITGLTVNGADLGDIALAHGTGLTQYGDSDGTVSAGQISQDGASSGDFIGVEIADGGVIAASYSNGKTRPLYAIPVATFTAENQLQHLDGGAYAATVASGSPTVGDGSAIVGQALEESNVDIADEFTKMIVTQQAYSANTRVISTSDSMMQEALAMIR